MVEDAVEDGVNSAVKAMKQGREYAKQGRDFAEDAIHDARYAIKRNPLQAAGIILAAGVVLGSIITLMSYRRD